MRNHAEDARALLVELYGTEGPRKCRHTRDLFTTAATPGGDPPGPAPAPAPRVQGELFTTNREG